MKNNIKDEIGLQPIPTGLFKNIDSNAILRASKDCEITYDQIPTILFKDFNNDAVLEIFKNCKCYQPNSDCDFPECESIL